MKNKTKKQTKRKLKSLFEYLDYEKRQSIL